MRSVADISFIEFDTVFSQKRTIFIPRNRF